MVKDCRVFLQHFLVQFDDCFLRVITCGFEDNGDPEFQNFLCMFYLQYNDAWILQSWRVCTKRLLTFAWMLCRDFNMENNGKLKSCFEEAWPPYGFTVFCKVTYCYVYRIYLSRCLPIVNLKTMSFSNRRN